MASYPPLPPSPTPRTTADIKSKFAVTDLTVKIPGPPARTSDQNLPKSRWRTKEFCFYYAVFIIVVPCMAKAVIDLSQGWMFGWKVDTSDHQWNTFRQGIPLLSAALLLWLAASFIYDKATGARNSASLSLPNSTQSAPRIKFILGFAIPLLLVLHGSSAPKMMLILYLNYRVAHLAKVGGTLTRFSPIFSWSFNLIILFANEIFDGYHWKSLGLGLGWLDAYGGVLARWHINWNITMLRLISYNMDLYWACTASSPAALSADNKQNLPSGLATPTEKGRIVNSHAIEVYSFVNYLGYALYPPLYLAGPIITFNSFLSQLQQPPKISRRLIFNYALRFFSCLLTMELVLHSMYVVAIKDESARGAWLGASPFQLSMLGFWNLIVVWLKLLIPWRFFRFWALFDGIDPPENMIRCMANNYSTLGFWRSWHRSYNLWIIRYLYVPLGGAKHAFVATLIVFTFVALWHDLSLKLLTWGWVISLFVLPEMMAQKLVPYSKFGTTGWYRHVAGLGGVVNVLMMMTANLIGFAIGTEGMKFMWSQIISTWAGLRFMLVACACLFVAVQIMFEYREEEKRRGIVRRC